MKRLIYSLVALSMLMFACNITSTSTPVVITQPPVPPTVTPVQATNPPPTPQANVNCNEVSVYVDPAIASGFDCQTIPESSGSDAPAWAINPQYTQITLTGYALSGGFSVRQINLFPVKRFTEIDTSGMIPVRVSDLQALIAGGAPGGEDLPLLPIFNAAQMFYSNYQVVPFVSGSGIRFVTMYGQDVGPVANNAVFYTFQGLTGDGKYWVSAILPVSSPILPADGSTLPGGESWDQFTANFPTYIVDIATQLNAQAPGSFSPTLAALDALVASITVKP